RTRSIQLDRLREA
ncbi:hypothetical protein Hypma_014979, partial [Hypsizygus marmoreus]